MTFYDVHEPSPVNASGSTVLVNNLKYMRDDSFLPVKFPSIGRAVEERRSGGDQYSSGDQSDGVKWTTEDASTLDAQRATRMCLDVPPTTSQIKDYWSIYDKNFNGNRYKSVYYHREDLPGQIQYYIDPEMANPFFRPLFPKGTRTLAAVFVDPMNNVHYDFRRPWNQREIDDDCQLTEFRDSQAHREDALANVMRVRNGREYEPVYMTFTTRHRV